MTVDNIEQRTDSPQHGVATPGGAPLLTHVTMPLQGGFEDPGPHRLARAIVQHRQLIDMPCHAWQTLPVGITDDMWAEIRGWGRVIVDNFDVGDESRSVVVLDVDNEWMLSVAGDVEHSDINVVATSPQVAEEFVLRVNAAASENAAAADTSQPDDVTVRFASYNGGAATWRNRQVNCPRWDEIAGNYTAAGANTMSALVGNTEPDTGKVILLWGPPGTGKTTAVRALAREWQPWCDSVCILDPEVLLLDPNYLHEVTVARDRDSSDRWRLIILEDLDSVLRSDARERAGTSLGRLLNISDGIAGQGMKTLLLITTNEPIAQINSALTRPGRCLASIELGRFDPVEGRRWLRDHGYPECVFNGPDMSLAELWAAAHGNPVVESNARSDTRAGAYL